MNNHGFVNTFVTPPKQDFDTVGFQGSMQQVLQENIGNYVIVDFLTGSDTIISKQGILYNVSSQFLVLYDDINLRYVVCDIFSIKFVTFLLPGYRPGQVLSQELVEEEEAIRAEADQAAGDQTQQSQTPAQEDIVSQELPADVATAAMTPAQAAYQYASRRRL